MFAQIWCVWLQSADPEVHCCYQLACICHIRHMECYLVATYLKLETANRLIVVVCFLLICNGPVIDRSRKGYLYLRTYLWSFSRLSQALSLKKRVTRISNQINEAGRKQALARYLD